jgi:hypothetical protein
MTPFTGNLPGAWLLLTQNNTNTEYKHKEIMSRVGFKPTILVFEQKKTACSLDTGTSVIGFGELIPGEIKEGRNSKFRINILA